MTLAETGSPVRKPATPFLARANDFSPKVCVNSMYTSATSCCSIIFNNGTASRLRCIKPIRVFSASSSLRITTICLSGLFARCNSAVILFDDFSILLSIDTEAKPSGGFASRSSL